MWTVLLLCLASARADEVKKVIVHTIPSTVDMGMPVNSLSPIKSSSCSLRCSDVHCQCTRNTALAFSTAIYGTSENKNINVTGIELNFGRESTERSKIPRRLKKSKKFLKWHWLCSNEANAKTRFLKDSVFCFRHPNGEQKTNKSANRTNKIEGRNVQPTRLYRKRILTPVEDTILTVAIGVTIILALCLVCIVALQCYCAKDQVFGENSESDSKSSLSPISSPVILEMLKLELERQKRKRREESIESDEDDSPV